MPEVPQPVVEPCSTQVVRLTTWCDLRGHLAHGGSPYLVCVSRLAPQPGAIQSAVTKPPLTSDFLRGVWGSGGVTVRTTGHFQVRGWR